ncbi:hypothetical protein ANO11243_064410 [Dothideomycetidae sp. 11243]|nr:hypothetical protein ANO11243_064410 [fungal sp. No.11243]
MKRRPSAVLTRSRTQHLRQNSPTIRSIGMADSAPRRPSEITWIKVGKPKTGGKTFAVDRKTICRLSSFFDFALDKERGWPESTRNLVLLPEDDPAVFTVFAKWLDTSIIYIDDVMKDHRHLDLGLLVRLYILADKLRAVDCKRAVVEFLRPWLYVFETLPTPTCVSLMEDFDWNDGLFRLLVHWFDFRATATDLSFELFVEAPKFVYFLHVYSLVVRARGVRLMALSDLDHYLPLVR